MVQGVKVAQLVCGGAGHTEGSSSADLGVLPAGGRGFQAGAQLFCNAACGIVAGVGQQDDELLATQAPYQIGTAHGAGGQLRCLAQHGVACGVAPGVVDVFEVVQVQQQNGRGAALALGTAQLLAGEFDKGVAVVEAGEAVLAGQPFQLTLFLFQCRLCLLQGVAQHRVGAKLAPQQHRQSPGQHTACEPLESGRA